MLALAKPSLMPLTTWGSSAISCWSRATRSLAAAASAPTLVAAASAVASVLILSASASRGADHLRDELLLAKLRIAFGHLRLLGENVLLRPGGCQRTGLSCLRLGRLDFSVILRPGDRSLTGILRLVAVGLLSRLSSSLIGSGLGDRRGLVDRSDMGLGEGLGVAGALIVDRFDLEGVHNQSQRCHLWLRLIEDLSGELLSFTYEILDGHRPDDGPEMTGKNPAGQAGHLVLVGEETSGSVRDRFMIVAHFERDHRLHRQGYPPPCHAGFEDLGLLHRQREKGHLGTKGRTKAPWPFTILNGAAPSPWPLEPLISIASSGEGIRQPNIERTLLYRFTANLPELRVSNVLEQEAVGGH